MVLQRGGGGGRGGEIHVFRSFHLQKLQMLGLTLGPDARGTAEVFGTEPCCLNIYSPLPLCSPNSLFFLLCSVLVQNIRL